jgi:hypothetical protein
MFYIIAIFALALNAAELKEWKAGYAPEGILSDNSEGGDLYALYRCPTRLAAERVLRAAARSEKRNLQVHALKTGLHAAACVRPKGRFAVRNVFAGAMIATEGEEEAADNWVLVDARDAQGKEAFLIFNAAER